ncbi:GNAT family N-acetyltransferase [Kamptonema animale CS-326]|jgi:ribosomal protein S18 acetylase RimI-like enzyme|uniref:GNAT family N-acetyltransferase n=1 Tax=Kamptonema animale TaxID=92934 RepID=UPI00232DEA79|nr:GNAT family N-acetyltransferase [Kamptonema animale]MDB9512849.1 GNAT family N-acetyltransferase [Kamptonema animale CS-326]
MLNCQIEVVTASTLPNFQTSLIEIYQTIFAEPPEFQHWEIPDLEQFFISYLNFGKLAVAIASDNQVVGFCASIPFKVSKLWESSALFSNNPVLLSANFFQECFQIDVENLDYIADLGVVKAFRHQGVGTQLMNTIGTLKKQPTLLRVSVCRPEAYALYYKLGFRDMGVKQWAEYRRIDGTIKSSEKILMFRSSARTDFC